MSALKLHTLKQKLWAIVAASFVARALIFLSLPKTFTTFAPDEGTYASLARWIGESKPAGEFPGFGESLYLSGRTLIVPASALVRLGLSDLDSIRLTSTIYGLLCLLIVVLATLRYFRFVKSDSKSRVFNEKLALTLILIYAFLPSHFLWSNLGLRESANEFWLLTSFLMFHITKNQKKKTRITGLVLLPLSIGLVFSSRPQVGSLLVLTLLLATLLNFKMRNLDKLLLCMVILAGFIFGQSLTTHDFKGISETIRQIENIPVQQNLNQVGASSRIRPPNCPFEESEKDNVLLCLAWRAPYMTATFMFRPIVKVDVSNNNGLAAAVENLAWFIFCLTILVLLYRGKGIPFFESLSPSILLFLLFVISASAYQGNMGTGFRHKSLILWVVLLMIFVLAWRKTESPEGNTRGNSQESAV
jgi:hypothetical protein